MRNDSRELFYVAPLYEEVFRETVPRRVKTILSDSLVVATQDGRFLAQGAAIRYLLKSIDE
jgi:hypothetical protein